MSAHVFEYRALDRTGRSCRGTARAPDRESAYRQVVAMGLTPLTLKAAAETRRRSRKVGRKDIAQFTYQLGVLIEARIPLSEGLVSLAEQETNEKLRRVLMDIAARVQAGQGVAASMTEHREFFGDVYLESIKAAEKSGTMVKILGHLSDMLDRTEEAARQVKSALMYPCVVVGTLGLATAFLVTFAVPRFAKMFAAKGIKLPLMTQALMTVGTSVQNYWWAYLLGAVGAFMTYRKLMTITAVRLRLDKFFHRLPILGRIMRGSAVARFCRVLGISLSSGIGLIEALEMAGKASGRPMLIEDSRRLVEQVRSGGRLSDVLGACRYFPTFAKRMISAGEQSGEIPKMCDTIARQYERETSMLTKNIGTVIEPILVVLIAVVVLLIALSIFLPMWDMVHLMS